MGRIADERKNVVERAKFLDDEIIDEHAPDVFGTAFKRLKRLVRRGSHIEVKGYDAAGQIIKGICKRQ